jgi:hypothetical protein
MNTFEAFELFVSLKQHFTQEKYDFFKYNGKVKGTVQRFEKLSDAQRYPFKKLANHRNPLGIVVSNLIVEPTLWIGNLKEERYLNWQKKIDSISYFFKNDVKKIDFSKDLQVENGCHPNLLVHYFGNNIELETLIILNKISRFFDYWDKNIEDNCMWPISRKLIIKYEPFLNIDIGKMREILIKTIGED